MGRFILVILSGAVSAVVLGMVYWALLALLKPALDRLRLKLRGDASTRATSMSPAIATDRSVAARMVARPIGYLEVGSACKLDPNYDLYLRNKLGPDYKLDPNCKLDPGYKSDLMHNYVLNPIAPLKLGLAQEPPVATVSLQQQCSAVVGGRLGQSYVDLGQFVYLNAGITLVPSEFLVDPAERHLLLTFSKQKTGGLQEPDEAPKDLAGVALRGRPSPEFHFAKGRKSASNTRSLAW